MRVARTGWAEEVSTSSRPPCKSLVKRKQNSPDARFGGARKILIARTPAAIVPLGGGSCLRRTGHPFVVSSSEGAVTQDYVCVHCQSRNNPRGASGVELLRSVGHRRDLAACALFSPFPLPQSAVMLPRSRAVLQGRSRAASDPPPAGTPPSSAPPQALRGLRFLSAILSLAL